MTQASKEKLAALPYYGGKSPISNSQTGPWIGSLLPAVTPGQTYVEPFAGMLSVLLNRARAQIEIVNDIDHRLINWWRVVRDRNDELAHKIDWTPQSRVEYEHALTVIDSEDPIESAWAVTVVITQSIRSTLNSVNSSWKARYTDAAVNLPHYGDVIRSIRNRIQRVSLECRNALDILERVSSIEAAVVYCDPPYGGENNQLGQYCHNETYYDDMVSLLTSEKLVCRVAISGYPGDWDVLLSHGWVAHTRDTKKYACSNKSVAPCTEVLWCNYDVVAQRSLFAE